MTTPSPAEPLPKSHGHDWSAADHAKLWALVGAADYDAEVDRLAAELGRSPGAIRAQWYAFLEPELKHVEKIPTDALARIVAVRLSRDARRA